MDNMKRIVKIAMLALLLVLFAVPSMAETKKEKNNDTQEVTFVVSIDCAGCVKKVEENLPFEKGVKDIKVTLEDRTVWIKYSPKRTTKEKLAAAIEKLGYQVIEEKKN